MVLYSYLFVIFTASNVVVSVGSWNNFYCRKRIMLFLSCLFLEMCQKKH